MLKQNATCRSGDAIHIHGWAATQNPMPEAVRWIFYVIGIIGMVDNGIIIVVMLASHHLRRRLANIIIVNQSIIDGLASFFLILVMVPYVGVPSPTVCKIWLNRLPLWCLLISSTYNILCLASDRHLAIIYPLWHKAFLTKRKIMLLLVFPWVVGCGFHASFAIPSTVLVNGTCLVYQNWPSEFVQEAFGLLQVIIEYILPILLQMYLYGRIIIVLKYRVQSGLSIAACSNAADKNRALGATNQLNSAFSRAQSNSLKIAAIVSICFVVCWTCDQVLFLIYFFHGSKYYDVELFSYALIFVAANCCINPFIYVLQHETFKCTLRKIFNKKWDSRTNRFRKRSSVNGQFKNIHCILWTNMRQVKLFHDDIMIWKRPWHCHCPSTGGFLTQSADFDLHRNTCDTLSPSRYRTIYIRVIKSYIGI